MNYSLLRKHLEVDVGIAWLEFDARDDFFPDPLLYADVVKSGASYNERRKHRALQVDAIRHLHEEVPKGNRLLRDAAWLHPTHRVLYLALLKHFLGRLASSVSSRVYSSRSEDADEEEYPFQNRFDHWKDYENRFREASLEASSGAVVVADIASFYDHINCDHLCDRILSVLGSRADEVDMAMLDLLRTLLALWSPDGFGIPQNHDPSGFLANFALHQVDREIGGKYWYIRWVDDIRIVARSESEALNALHDLQRALAKERFFLAGNKTYVAKVGSERFQALVDVEDEQLLSKAEEAQRARDCKRIGEGLEDLFDRLAVHSSPLGDERKFRAFANRLLGAGDFKGLSRMVHPRLREHVLPRLASHPERSDYWAKILSARPTLAVVREAESLLVKEPSVFDWQRFHLWRLLTAYPKDLPASLVASAVEAAVAERSDAVSAQAIVCAGRHGDNGVREEVFRSHYAPRRSYLVQRAALLAIQELPEEIRERHFRRALRVNSDHRDLVEYLSELEQPRYGPRPRDSRACAETPVEEAKKITRGVGLVKGEKVEFRLTRDDYDY